MLSPTPSAPNNFFYKIGSLNIRTQEDWKQCIPENNKTKERSDSYTNIKIKLKIKSIRKDKHTFHNNKMASL